MANGDRVGARCDNCGQNDDHPKLHYGAEIYHHDCIPARVIDDIEGETQYQVVENSMTPGGRELQTVGRRKLADDELPEAVVRLRSIIKAAKGGKHGDKLLTHINSIHDSKGE